MSWNIDTAVGAPWWSQPAKVDSVFRLALEHSIHVLVLQEVCANMLTLLKAAVKRVEHAAWALVSALSGFAGPQKAK